MLCMFTKRLYVPCHIINELAIEVHYYSTEMATMKFNLNQVRFKF